MKKIKETNNRNGSARSLLRYMTPGETVTMSTQNVRLSYLRSLASTLKRDYGTSFSVSICGADQICVTRIK